MHRYLNKIKIIAMFLLVIFLYSFSSIRNNKKSVSDVKINFIGSDNFYIKKSTVDKLLVEGTDYIKCLTRDQINLNLLESKITSHEMIESAEVYLSINGQLKVNIVQRQPIARVVTNKSYYIDSKGKKMPLSYEHSARVMLIHGILNNSNFDSIFSLINEIKNDKFMSLYVTDILINNKNLISMKLRDCSFDLILGDANRLKNKIRNFKAFYQKAKSNNILNNYKTVNLQYHKQVVGIK